MINFNSKEREDQFLRDRARRFLELVKRSVISDEKPFEARFRLSDEPVAFADRRAGEYRAVRPGETWGRNWQSAWFHLRGAVPEAWAGRAVAAHLDFGGEALIFDEQGEPVHALTRGSVFDHAYNRDFHFLCDACRGGENVELWIETAAQHLFGLDVQPDPALGDPDRCGAYAAVARRLHLVLFEREVWHLWLDGEVLFQVMETQPAGSVRRARVLRALLAAADAFGDEAARAPAARAILRRELERPASSSDLASVAVGHAHIDVGWLWPVRESIRKAGRTFASQVDLVRRYPGYVFGASQPQLYAFVKQHYPGLYRRVQECVRAGSWEAQGGMWVEADCNLASGESLVRQILHGKNFFRDEFGVDVRHLWLPDIFGYSAALPQILKRSGIDYFLTIKISWNQFNAFPHTSFRWRGLDGSEVLAHFPPEFEYNSATDPRGLVKARDNFAEKDRLEEFMTLFGTGDGGGGPQERHIEMALRQADLEGTPRVSFGRAADFFERLSQRSGELATWVGELYLELHRGTLTTQALVKKMNRRLEFKFREVEMLFSALPLSGYPGRELDQLWKQFLTLQFHDILPGSSIRRVYEDTHREHREIEASLVKLAAIAADRLFERAPDAIALFNPLSTPHRRPFVLPAGWKGCAIEGAGRVLAFQPGGAEGSATLLAGELLSSGGRDARAPVPTVLLEVEPLGFATLLRRDTAAPVAVGHAPGDKLVLENDLMRYEFANDGTLARAFDKELRREVLAGPGNLLALYVDRPNAWDAWDVDITYENQRAETARLLTSERLPGGPALQGLRLAFSVGSSRVDQEVLLAAGSRRLEFRTAVDWRERHRMLRVSFATAVRAERATFEIQYGRVERFTHRNTSIEMARFESCAHRYVDLSDGQYGVALLNDCKYGHKVLDGVLDLNLLRSPTHPDPEADRGQHEFTYALLPHPGGLVGSTVIAEAAALNQPLAAFPGFRAAPAALPLRAEGAGVSLEVLKKAEKEDLLVARLVETEGRRSAGRLLPTAPGGSLAECDLMEWNDGAWRAFSAPLEVELGPFEIRTYKLKKNSSE